jgi:large subunit ribosomal protein L3
MSIGLVGKKCGMSRLFTEDGRSLPVTLIEATPNRVTQVKTADGDGYVAVQVTAGAKRASLLTKPAKGHFAKAKVEPGRGLWEFRLDGKDADKYAVGAEIKVDEVFKVGQMVDVAGVTKGKGLKRTIKRCNIKMGEATHRNTLTHREPGTIGQRQTPGRVFPGKKMAGQMGNVNRSAVNLEVVRIDAERHLIAVKGAVPGATGGDVIVRPAAKG